MLVYDDTSDAIFYQDLTFETAIATRLSWRDGNQREALPMPDLRDYDNPLDWSLTRKKLMTYLACSVSVVAAYAAGSYASAAEQLEREWHVSFVAYNVGILVFTIGFGIAPMVLAPFSEINGRRPVFISTGFVFVVCQMWCSRTNNYPSMLFARFFVGVGGSTFSTMVAGILADIWITKDRNTAMVFFTGATLLGTGLGPLVSGFLAQNLEWRWVFYVQIITSGVLVLMVTVFFRETRGSVLLSRKARALNRWYETMEQAGARGVYLPSTPSPLEPNMASTASDKSLSSTVGEGPVVRLRYRCIEDEQRASIFRMITLSLYRPMHMLVTEPVVFWFSLWVSFSWAVLYLQFGAIPLVFEVNHGFTLQQTGAVFTAMCVAAIVMVFVSIWQDQLSKRHFPARFPGNVPEERLYFTCIESALMPVGLFWFGWTCNSSIHWIVPTIGLGIATAGIFSIYLAVFNYSADVYRIYASSALAASGLCRNLLGGSFPLITRQIFTSLGFQTASSILGGIGLFLTLVPWVLVWYGPEIRKRSRIARQFVEDDMRNIR